ncbi:hypothetical protein RF644_14880 [Kocuria sp. CPCC 205258]|uniref:hypothetical protein n=1 Tax=Kocuria sp. CPCC 205258 TaxID=3073552 RepID=UPI0034D40B12
MRIIDRNRFLLLGGVTDWQQLARLHDPRSPARVKEQAARRGLESLEIVQLRWLTAKTLGYPTEPFTVWRRPAEDQGLHEPRFRQIRLLGLQLITFDTPQVFVQVRVDGAQGGVITAWAGAPWTSTLVGEVVPGNPTQFVSFSATALQSLVLPSSATVSEVTALDDALAEDPRWEPIETVALPVTPEWASVGGFGNDQGFLQAPVPPPEAAIDRFRRGAPLLGWHGELRPGIPAPPWELADPKAMVQVLHDAMLPELLVAVTTLPQERQHEYEIDHVLDSFGGDVPALLRHRPLETLLYGASTDGLSSLVSGFGSAYEETLVLDERRPAHAAHDYMVTARYENGVGADPGPVEFAAVLHHPVLLAPPPAPANLRTEALGLNAPAQRDGRWAPVLRITWDALAAELGLRVGAYAFAREDLGPAGGVVPLMRPRLLDTALQPLGMGPTGPAAAERAATDDTVQIDPALDPNTMDHAVAHHDLFGLFSTWSLSPAAVREPPVERATITAARWDVLAAVPGATTPADLVLDLTWDWSVRAPELIRVAGRLYPQSQLGEPPADRSVPGGLAPSLLTPGTLLQIAFEDTGAAATVSVTPGLTATVRYLSADGKTVGDTPVTDAGPRRYQVTVSGYLLDFDAAARQGMALWASGREKLPPRRDGSWSAEPVIASTADPRPPVLANTREFVQLAGLADPDGRHHAVLEWDPAPGAISYFAYTCAEAKFLADRGLPPPDLAQTLEQRLVRLRDAFTVDPDRRSFDRVNALPVPGTRMPLVLPRGTKEIHLYLVLGLSAGQVESTWPVPGSPGLRNRFVAFAAPQVVAPAAPQLEVAQVFDQVGATFGATVRIRSAPGALVSRLDLHRVRVPEAAVDIESMGPPIAAITGTAAPFTVAPIESEERGVAQVIGSVRGTDPVPGSWRTVHYRAVAWSADDPARGLLGGRSPASALRTVIVPPATPPDIEALSWRAAGADVVVDTAVLAPVAPTPLGPHRVTAAVHAHHPDGSVRLVLRHPAPATPPDADADRLDRVPQTPGVLWRDPSVPTVPGGPGRTPLHLAVPRSTVDDALTVRLRVTDPLGRFTERILEVPAGPPPHPPDILAPRVDVVVSRGRFLSFETTVPDTDGLGRPYQLSITLRPTLIDPRPRVLRVRLDLADIPALRPGENPASDRSPIPVRRSVRGAGTGISALLRTDGTVSVVLTAPDGTTATWSGPRMEF